MTSQTRSQTPSAYVVLGAIEALGWERGGVRVFVIMDRVRDRLAVRRVVLESVGTRTSDDELHARALAAARRSRAAGFGGGEGLTTALLRSLPLQSLVREVEEREPSPNADDLEFPGASFSFRPKDAQTLGFRNIRDLRAHVRWLRTAAIYSKAVENGRRAPVNAVVRKLSLTKPAARSAVERARSHGYLTKSSRGRPGGRLTPQGLDRIAMIGELVEAEEG